MSLKRSLTTLWLTAVSLATWAQNQPIGYWSSLLSYNTGAGLATDGTNLFSCSKQGFFVFKTNIPEIVSYSKVNGMSDLGMQGIAYDSLTQTVILAYENGNIDLFQDEIFYNIPDLKLKTVAGDKKIFQIYCYNGKGYLSTSLGIIVIDLEKHSLDETYQFIVNNQFIGINGFTALGDYFYATTSNGLFRANKNSLQLQNFQIWEKIDSTHVFTSTVSYNDKLVLSTKKNVYVLADTLREIYTSSMEVINISTGNNNIYVSEYTPFRGKIATIDTSLLAIDTFKFPDKAMQIVNMKDKSTWISFDFNGLAKRTDTSKYGFFLPAGPGDVSSWDIYAKNKRVHIAHGGFSDKYIGTNNLNGVTIYDNGKWTSLRRDPFYSYGPFGDTMSDFTSIVRDEKNDVLYAGSFTHGLFELRADGTPFIYNKGSFLGMSTVNGGQYAISGLGIDGDNNIWATMYGSYHEIYMKESSSGNWYKYHVSYSRPYIYSGGPMTFDQNNNIWYASLNGGGVIGYSTNYTPADTTDDYSVHLINGVGFGNLPNSKTNCVAIDKNDNLWIGTSDGIGILYNASGCIKKRCDAEIPVVQYDKYAGYLFAGENVKTIAVDGANRKWIGTDNGVWLLSPDAGNSKIIMRFNEDNSPLPSNRVQKIAIDQVTGDVYIGTQGGMVCYRGTATEGTPESGNVITFPNPVPSDYKGTIAIRGLPENADVRITDVNGQLVYKTTALGGQAVWSGTDYKGRRPQTGVYLIFASNTDGGQTYAGKLVFIQ